MNRKKILTWTGGLIMAVATGLLVDQLKDYVFLNAVWSGICLLINGVAGVLIIDVKLWLILVLIATAIFILLIAKKAKSGTFIKSDGSSHQCSHSKILDYTSENYGGILWKFSWEKDGNTWKLINLTPCCPKDGTPLNQTECPRCGTDYFGKNGLDLDKAKILIKDNAKRMLQYDWQ